ncbi:MAG: transglycosylase SLT domain-containing protein [Gammaproteobacteria bacterium]
MTPAPLRAAALGLALLLPAAHAPAREPPAAAADAPTDTAEAEAAGDAGSVAAPAAPAPLPPGTRSGREIVENFVAGLADPDCAPGDGSDRWRRHFAGSPQRLAASDETLAMFGYVVDALREAHLPTEYALIPFVESGYKPGARSPGGPVGLWQFIALTARNHKVPVRAGYDGRLSPVASTRAAVRYLKTLHGMFAGDWRLAAMAFNAGEYRILGALRRAGMAPASADPDRLPGLSGITYAYPRKMHAISCLLQEADDRAQWLQALDRPVPRLVPVELPGEVRSLAGWAARHGLDLAQLRRLNPAWSGDHVPRRAGETLRVLVPEMPGLGATAVQTAASAGPAPSTSPATSADAGTQLAASGRPRDHVVARGESLWTIARRHGVPLQQLRTLNALGPRALLQPGMVLRIEGPAEPAKSSGGP